MHTGGAPWAVGFWGSSSLSEPAAFSIGGGEPDGCPACASACRAMPGPTRPQPAFSEGGTSQSPGAGGAGK
eukprot:5086266-Lingulodinium_polyedra.AAC.1